MSRGTLDTVRRAVRAVVERTPELRRDPALQRRLAESMVRVCATACDLMEVDGRLTDQIGRRRSSTSPAFSTSPAGEPAAVAAGMSASDPGKSALARAQAAGDFHRRTAVDSAAGVLQNVRNAIDFPGFVTSLITGVFQAMNTSTIQQLTAYADLLGAVGMSTGQFAASSITTGRAMDWAAQRFPVFRVVTAEGAPPILELGESADMPEEDELKSALDATEEEVSTIQEDELEETLLPLVKRKLARDRQAMLSTMLLMGMNRIVVDAGRIHASMNLQVDARSTAEQNKAERADTRVTTGGSASFGTGMWGASANMQATVGYVTSDEQFSREEIAVRAGLRSDVEVNFHTEPIQLNRMTSEGAVRDIRNRSMNPVAEHQLESLLPADTGERRTRPANFQAVPELPATPPPAPDSDEARSLRQRRDFSAAGGSGGGDTASGATPPSSEPAPTATPAPTPAPAPEAEAHPPESHD